MDRDFTVLKFSADFERRIGTTPGSDVNRFVPGWNQVADRGDYVLICHML
jgi:hypothetical protein